MTPHARLLCPAFALSLLGVLACDRRAQPGEAAPAASASTGASASRLQAPSAPSAAAAAAAPTGSPISRLVPRARPAGPRASCPLSIEPGVAFGPVSLGETVGDLEKAGLKVKSQSDSHAEITLPAGAKGPGGVLKVSLCQGKIIDIWIDDLRLAPDCVAFAGKPIARATPRADVETLLGGCPTVLPGIGGTMEACAGGGVVLGHGMGDFLQIRVRPRGYDLRDACAIASDDGSPIELSPGDRIEFVEKALNLRELGPYWHVDQPGRDPLRIVNSRLVPQVKLMMFGSPVDWIAPVAAREGTAYFEVTGLRATKTMATLEFAYPIEGVVGTVTFRHQGASWSIERSQVTAKGKP
jgi:hypothetical protein